MSFRTRNHSIGFAAKPLAILLGSMVVVGVLCVFILRLRPEAERRSGMQNTIKIYCAAGIAKPVQEVLDRYNAEFGTALKIDRTGGSGALAGQINTEFETNLRGGADLYITADQFLLEKAAIAGIVKEQFQLAEQRPVVAVRASSDVDFDSFEALVRANKLRFGIASERAAVGKLARKIARQQGFLEPLEKNKVTDFENVMTLGQALVAKSIDAAIIWDTTVAQINQNSSQEVLRIACRADNTDQVKSNIAVGVIASSSNPTQCLQLARYLTAPSKSKSAFEAYGFTFISGDQWSEVPEIHLFCGSMFTPVIEETVRDFAKREGINLYPKWEGCGKLVTRMQTADGSSRFPDAYFACDEMFLDKVKEHFQRPISFSQNEIVIATRDSVPASIKTLDQLLEVTDLRIGVCDPEQSALGQLTKELLTHPPYENRYAQIHEQASVIVDVGPTLVSQLLAGGLDAAIVYRSNVMADPSAGHELRIIELDRSSRFSVAQQPWAVSRSTAYPRLMDRLFARIQSEQVKKQFQEHGFRLIK